MLQCDALYYCTGPYPRPSLPGELVDLAKQIGIETVNVKLLRHSATTFTRWPRPWGQLGITQPVVAIPPARRLMKPLPSRGCSHFRRYGLFPENVPVTVAPRNKRPNLRRIGGTATHRYVRYRSSLQNPDDLLTPARPMKVRYGPCGPDQGN